MLEKLEIGKPYRRIEGRGECVLFNIDYPNIELVYNLDSPTPKEYAETLAGKPFEIRAVEVSGVVFVASRFGALNWMDAPYNPNIGNFHLDPVPPGTSGYGLQFILTDSRNWKILNMRLIGLGNRFSVKFYDMLYANKPKIADVAEHDAATKSVYSRYSTRDLVKLSTLRYRTDGGS